MRGCRDIDSGHHLSQESQLKKVAKLCRGSSSVEFVCIEGVLRERIAGIATRVDSVGQED